MSNQFLMPTPTVPPKPLTSFKSLSFDIYGTLIDWEDKVTEDLEQLVNKGSAHGISTEDTASRAAKLRAMLFDHATIIQAKSPTIRYARLMTEAYLEIATRVGIAITDEIKTDADAFGEVIGDWPAFKDTADAMARLGKHYKLIALSNVDNASVKRTISGPLQGLEFWRVYTAEDIGSYKPSLRNFEYLLKHIDEADRSEGGSGISHDKNLHVAQSLFHDQRPAKEMGLSSVWINRDKLDAGDPFAKEVHDDASVGYGWRYETLSEFADEVEKQFPA